MMRSQGDVALSDDMPRSPAPPGWETSAVYGCWELASCWSEESGACWWVDDGLCSHCVEAETASIGTLGLSQQRVRQANSCEPPPVKCLFPSAFPL